MIDFLLAPPNILIILGAIFVFSFLFTIQLFLDHESGYVWPIWCAMALIALYHLFHGVAWLVARFMNTMHSY